MLLLSCKIVSNSYATSWTVRGIFQERILASESESCLVVSDSLLPHGLYSPWNSPGQNTGVSIISLLQGIFQPRSPALQADSLPAEPQGKSTNTGVCSLSLLQGIFLTQESNWDFLHCRWILYQLSYQGTSRVCLPS